MPSIILPGRFNQPPHGLLEADPIAIQQLGLVQAIVPAGGGRMVDVVSGEIGNHTSGTPTQEGTLIGRAVRHNAAITQFTTLSQPWMLGASQKEHTVLVVAIPRANATSWQSIVHFGTGNFDSSRIQLYRTESANRYVINAAGGAGAIGTPATLSSAVMGAPLIGAASVSGSEYSYLLNGITSYGTNSRLWNSLPNQLNIGSTANSADVLLVARFTTYMGLERLRELSDNPWQIFKPRRRKLYFDVASGGGATTHQVTASNSASTPSVSAAAVGQVHQVTVAVSASTPGAAAAAIAQTHLVGVASASSQPTATGAAVSQTVTHQVTVANASSQPVASSVDVAQTHPVVAASASGTPAATAAAIAQTHLIGVASASSQPVASGAAVSTDATHFVSASSTSSAPAASAAAIRQTHLITMPGVAIDSVAGTSTVVQEHLVAAASATSQPAASAAVAGAEQLLTATPGWTVAAPARDWTIDQPARNWTIAAPARNWSITS